MWEKLWTTCKWQWCIISSRAWQCAHDRDVRITSPTYWRRLWVRLVPSILLISAHSTFFSSTLPFLALCGTHGNSQRPASKPVQRKKFFMFHYLLRRKPCEQHKQNLCSASVWAETRALPHLPVSSPHRSYFAPLEEASSLVFWGSSEHPGHHPRALRDRVCTPHCPLREVWGNSFKHLWLPESLISQWQWKTSSDVTYCSPLYQAGMGAFCPASPSA